jgi:hypothetical protein
MFSYYNPRTVGLISIEFYVVCTASSMLFIRDHQKHQSRIEDLYETTEQTLQNYAMRTFPNLFCVRS